jgi:Helix-turn-helix domain
MLPNRDSARQPTPHEDPPQHMAPPPDAPTGAWRLPYGYLNGDLVLHPSLLWLLGEQVNHSTITVYLWLAAHVDDSHRVPMSQAEGAKATGLHKTTIVKALNNLERHGLVVREYRSSKYGQRQATVIRLLPILVDNTGWTYREQ